MQIDFSGIHRSSLQGKLLRLPLRLLPAGMPVRVVQGPLRGTRWIAGAGTHGCWLGSYERSKADLFRSLVAEGTIVYDLGANVGFYTLLAARMVGASGRVYAFEPLPGNCGYLRRHLQMNRTTNVSVVEMAVSFTNGEATFDPAANRSMGHLAERGNLTVRTVSLDAFVLEEHMPGPHVIKIDVEGAEANVLRGGLEMLRKHRPLIFLSTHGVGVHRECRAILQELNYSVESIDGQPIEKSDELLARPSKAGM